MINFRKGSKDEFAKLPPEAGFDDRADIIRRHLAEVFGSKNLSFLIGSGCSSYPLSSSMVTILSSCPRNRQQANLDAFKKEAGLIYSTAFRNLA